MFHHHGRVGCDSVPLDFGVRLARCGMTALSRIVLVQRELDKRLTLISDSGPSEADAVTTSWGSAPDPGVL